MLSQEEEIFEKPTLTRTKTMSNPPPVVRSTTLGTRMTIDELDTTLPTYSKHPLVQSETHRDVGNNLFRTTNHNRSDNIFDESCLQPKKLRREVPSDYGVFDENFEHDLYNWFAYCSNKKKAEYIKHLTDHIILVNNNRPSNITLRREEPYIKPHSPFISVNQTHVGTHQPDTLSGVLNEPELESIFSSTNKGYKSPYTFSRGVQATTGMFDNINNSKSSDTMIEDYSDDEFEENDPNEITMRHDYMTKH